MTLHGVIGQDRNEGNIGETYEGFMCTAFSTQSLLTDNTVRHSRDALCGWKGLDFALSMFCFSQILLFFFKQSVRITSQLFNDFNELV